MLVGLRQRAELADAGLEPPRVEREAQLGQLTRDAQVVRIERPKRPDSGHVGHRAVLADRHHSSPRPEASSCSRVHASTESSSNTCSTTPYGGPWSQLGSSVMDRCSVRFDLSFGSTATLTTACGSSEMATTTREPTSVQRQRLPPHQNSRPRGKSLRLIGDDPHVQGTQKYSALRRGGEYEGRPLRGEGLTAAEIASPPGIGAWTERL